MPSRIVIRHAGIKDSAAFLDLIDALAEFEKLKKPTSAARKRLIRDGFGKTKRFDSLLAFTDGKAVGYAIFFETYSSFLSLPTLYLEDIFVLPEYRGRRIGMMLFRKCLAEKKRRHCGRMEWMVLNWNKGAMKFYNKLGATRLKKWIVYRLES